MFAKLKRAAARVIRLGDPRRAAPTPRSRSPSCWSSRPAGVEEVDRGDTIEYAVYGARGRAAGAARPARGRRRRARRGDDDARSPTTGPSRWRDFHRPGRRSAAAARAPAVGDPPPARARRCDGHRHRSRPGVRDRRPRDDAAVPGGAARARRRRGALVDLGCGSGVLAIAAAQARLGPGARRRPRARRRCVAARENARGQRRGARRPPRRPAARRARRRARRPSSRTCCARCCAHVARDRLRRRAAARCSIVERAAARRGRRDRRGVRARAGPARARARRARRVGGADARAPEVQPAQSPGRLPLVSYMAMLLRLLVIGSPSASIGCPAPRSEPPNPIDPCIVDGTAQQALDRARRALAARRRSAPTATRRGRTCFCPTSGWHRSSVRDGVAVEGDARDVQGRSPPCRACFASSSGRSTPRRTS